MEPPKIEVQVVAAKGYVWSVDGELHVLAGLAHSLSHGMHADPQVSSSSSSSSSGCSRRCSEAQEGLPDPGQLHRGRKP